MREPATHIERTYKSLPSPFHCQETHRNTQGSPRMVRKDEKYLAEMFPRVHSKGATTSALQNIIPGALTRAPNWGRRGTTAATACRA
eukprot:6932454-Prymnesium_polylepis.2